MLAPFSKQDTLEPPSNGLAFQLRGNDRASARELPDRVHDMGMI
jgi:hypothetical protein